ncbi:MAG TPA: ATP-binding protein [Steroidobacteraceae bacterium]|nr:ATP-binding protein [Steroidobacteraceae bacterium]
MSIRLKLLLLGLATLVLPWAGCRYAREMETALREGEQSSLLSVAQTIAASLQGRGDLLYRQPAPLQIADDAQTSEEAVVEPDAKPSPYDLRPILLSAQPFLDGYVEEWPQNKGAWRYFARDQHRFGVLTGVFERMLYVMLDVHDDHVVYDSPGASPLDPSTFGDRIWIGFEGQDGHEHQVFVAAMGPGSVTARRIETGEYGQLTAVNETRILGALQPTAQGYRLELRIPLSMLGEHFGVLIDDRNQRGADPVSYGTLRSDDLHTVGRLIAAAPELTGYLKQFSQPGLRIAVAAPEGRLLAQADALSVTNVLGPERGILAQFYRRFVDRPGTRRVIDSSADIYDREHKRVIGSLLVSQTEDRWLVLRDRALTHMLNLTLVISGIAVIATFIFAASLAVRLSRLRAASESALTREGLVTTFPETDASDELGDVARGFSTLLHRLNEYTGYLRTLAGKLAHEIRTPLTIVRSSLENLESEGVSSSARVYLDRARQGSERLNGILVAMGAATRVEEAISNAERMRFDLVPVVKSAADAYRIAFPERAFATETPDEPVEIEGAPDLIVQMLDKLVDNAVDFSPAGAQIVLRVRLEPHAAVVEVDNPGPPLSPDTRDRLFESLWQSRSGDSDSRPHFGLGLYIVRLIAEFHDGKAAATSLPGDTGARFTVRLSMG